MRAPTGDVSKTEIKPGAAAKRTAEREHSRGVGARKKN